MLLSPSANIHMLRAVRSDVSQAAHWLGLVHNLTAGVVGLRHPPRARTLNTALLACRTTTRG